MNGRTSPATSTLSRLGGSAPNASAPSYLVQLRRQPHASTATVKDFDTGFADLFALRTRPNPVLAPREVYEAKTARWQAQWPELEVMPWARCA